MQYWSQQQKNQRSGNSIYVFAGIVMETLITSKI